MSNLRILRKLLLITLKLNLESLLFNKNLNVAIQHQILTITLN